MISLSQSKFVSRIGEWFRFRSSSDQSSVDASPAEMDAASAEAGAIAVRDDRPSFWRPWGRRDAALLSLQRGFDGLTDLMTVIRDNLEAQGRRQGEIIEHLAQLPKAFESVPEAQQAQAETLKAIGQQLQQQIKQQDQLGDILAKVTEAAVDQQRILEDLHGRVDGIAGHDSAIVDNLKDVGTAIQTIGRTNQSSTQVLQQLHQDLSSREGEIERVLQRQDKRVTAMLGASIAVSAVAVVAVIVVSVLLFRRPAPAAPAPASPLATSVTGQ